MLETRLVEVMRFEKGQVYGVQVADDFSLAPPQLGCIQSGTLNITFQCDPAESDELIEVVHAELRKLRNGEKSFTDTDVTSAIERERREFEEQIRKNDFWAGTILDL